jgi:hypothetical protein
MNPLRWRLALERRVRTELATAHRRSAALGLRPAERRESEQRAIIAAALFVSAKWLRKSAQAVVHPEAGK